MCRGLYLAPEVRANPHSTQILAAFVLGGTGWVPGGGGGGMVVFVGYYSAVPALGYYSAVPGYCTVVPSSTRVVPKVTIGKKGGL